MRVLTVVASVALAACETLSASDVDPCNTTECLTPYVSVRATADHLDVSASFWDRRSAVVTSTPSPIPLDDDDRMTLSFGEAAVDLVLIQSGDTAGEYQAMLPLAAPLQAGDVISLAVSRVRSTSATIMMSAPATVVVESLPSNVSRANDVVIALNHPTIDDQLALGVVGNGCTTKDGVVSSHDESRSGMATIEHTAFVSDASLTCDVALHVERSVPAQVMAPFWPPGELPNVTVMTIADATFTSTP